MSIKTSQNIHLASPVYWPVVGLPSTVVEPGRVTVEPEIKNGKSWAVCLFYWDTPWTFDSGTTLSPGAVVPAPGMRASNK